jgi:hypothetical protein
MQEVQNPTTEKSVNHLDVAIQELGARSKQLNSLGLVMSVVSVIVAISFCLFLFLTTDNLLRSLNQATSEPVTLVFLVVRSSAIGGVAITVLVSMMSMANACFDQ